MEGLSGQLIPPLNGLFGLVHDMEVTYEGRVPAEGPAVVAANHYSHIDPIVVGVATGRAIRYLAVDELFGQSHLFDNVTMFFGTIPLPRSGVPLSALRTSLEHLDAGGVVGLFPEGKRVERWGERPPKEGAAWLSLRAGAPLVPMAVHGSQEMLSLTDKAYRRAPLRVWVGEPMDPYDYMDTVDPRTAMTRDWFDWVDAKLQPWRD